MEKDFVTKVKTFVRVCLHFAICGVLYLSDEDCLRLYKEVLIMTNFLRDKDTMMLALVNLGHSYALGNEYQKALSFYKEAKSIAIEIGDKNVEGYCHVVIGKLYYNLDNYSDAINALKLGLAVTIKTKNIRYQKFAYIHMAATYKKLEDFPQVVNCYKEWLKMSTKGDEQFKGVVFERLGDAYQELHSFQQAVECYERSLEIAKKLQDQNMERAAYRSLGQVHHIQKNFQNAIHYHGKELDLAMKLEDKKSDAIMYFNLGLVYLKIANYAMAIEFCEKALAISKTIGNIKNIEALAYGTLGCAYRIQGDLDKSIQHHKSQLKIFKEMDSKDGQSYAYCCLGGAYMLLGNYQEAIECQRKYLEICVKIDNKEGKSSAHRNLGEIYYSIGRYNEAIDHLKKSVLTAKQTNNRHLIENSLRNLATTIVERDNVQDIIPYFEEFLKFAVQVGAKQNEGSAYLHLAFCQTVLGQYSEALKILDKLISLSEDIGDKSLQAMGYHSKGINFEHLNDYQQAIHCFEKELKIAKEMEFNRAKAMAYQWLGRLYGQLYILNKSEEQEKREKSENYLRESLRCSEWLFDHLQEDHLKISIVETFITTCYGLTNILILNNEHKEALLVSERGKARALNELLVSNYNLNKDNQAGCELRAYADIENMATDCVFYAMQSMLDWYHIWIIGSTDSPSLRLGIEESELCDLVNSAYNTLKVGKAKCEDRSIQTHEPQEKQTIFLPKKSPLDEMEKFMSSSHKKIKERCICDEDLYGDDNLNPLDGLYKALISPVLHLLTKDEIVIIPDRALFTVPFAALRDPSTGEYLSETKRIRLAPSLTSLKALQECAPDFHCETGALIIGNPKVGTVMYKGKTKDISDLPDAETEAQMISDLLGVQPLIGSRANKEAIKQNLSEGVAVIHFAAHGTTDGEIFLTPSTTDGLPSEKDYILTMKEVQESGVRPQLVVLSCCHSGRGEIKAEGVVGMSRAFLAAGARAVVASLWAIADEATMVFMEKFYSHLKEGESVSKSLQQAMKDMRGIPKYSDPQFWAPFFLIGDDVTIKI